MFGQWYLFYSERSAIHQQAVGKSGKPLVSQITGILLRKEGDAPTIGILLCKNKDRMVAEYGLSDINKPIGI